MNCPSGLVSVMEGSTTATDGCGECALGSYSSGDENTNCLPHVRPAGHKAAKVGARTETDGCEICVAVFNLLEAVLHFALLVIVCLVKLLLKLALLLIKTDVLLAK